MPIGSVGVGRLVAQLVLDTTQFTAGLGRAQSAMASAGAAMQRAGRAMTTFVTLPVVAAGAAGIKMATDFEQAFAKMEGLAGVPRAELARLKQAVLDLSEETGRPPQELAEGLFFIASSGYEASEALGILNVAAKAARAGMGATQNITDLTTAVISAYGKENINAAEAVDTLTHAIVLGKAEPDLMARSLGYVIPIAAQMGVDFQQVAAAVAAMSRKMSASNVSTAVTNLRQMLSDLLSPTKGARDALEAWGTSAQELRDVIRKKGLLEALAFINDQMNDNDEAFSQIFGNVRALTGALELAGVSSQDVSMIFNEMKNNTGQLDRAVAAMSDTMSDRWNRSMASLKVAAIELGMALMPLFERLVQAVKGAAQWFSSLDQSSKDLAVNMALVAAAAGPVLTVLGSVALILASITWEIALVIGSLALLGLAFVYVKDNWEAFKERLGDWSWWRNAIIGMAQFLIKYNPTMLLLEPLRNFINYLISLNPLMRGLEIPDFAQMAIDGLDLLKVETKEYEHQFGSMKEALLNGWKDIKDAMSGLFTSGGRPAGMDEITPPKSKPFIRTTTKASFTPTLTPILTGPIEHNEKLRDRLHQSTKAANQLSQAFQTTLTNAIIGFGETMADVFTGDAGVKGFFDNIMLVVADFMSMFGKALIAAGVASEAFQNLLGNPFAAIAAGTALVVAAGVVRNLLKEGPGGGGAVQGLATGGVVTSGGVFQLHRDEMVALPRGAAVTPAHMVNGGGNGGGGSLSTEIGLRRFIIEFDRERQRMGR